MAERRMFAKTIIDSDAFLDMPLSAQALYFHLSMRADDEGFINNPKKIMRMVGASDDDMKILIIKKFIIPFDTGVVVIKHWRIHNYIRADRLVSTKYQEERQMLSVKENGSYTLDNSECPSSDGQVSDKCLTSDSIGKDSIGKDSIGKNRVDDVDKLNNIIENKKNNITYYGVHHNIPLTDEELKEIQLKCPYWQYYLDRISEVSKNNGKKYPAVSTALKWYEEDKAKGKWPVSSPASYDLSGYTQRSLMHKPVYKKKEKKE